MRVDVDAARYQVAARGIDLLGSRRARDRANLYDLAIGDKQAGRIGFRRRDHGAASEYNVHNWLPNLADGPVVPSARMPFEGDLRLWPR